MCVGVYVCVCVYVDPEISLEKQARFKNSIQNEYFFSNFIIQYCLLLIVEGFVFEVYLRKSCFLIASNFYESLIVDVTSLPICFDKN